MEKIHRVPAKRKIQILRRRMERAKISRLRVEKLRLPMERHRKNQKILPEQQRAVPTTAQRAVPEVIVKTGKSRVKIRLNSKQRLSL